VNALGDGPRAASSRGRARRRGVRLGRRVRTRWRPRLAALALAALVALAPLAVVGAQVDRSEQQRLQSAIDAGQRLLTSRRAEIAAITRELGELDARLTEQIAERDRVANRITELRGQRDALARDVQRLQGERDAALVRIAGLEADLALMEERVRGLLIGLHRSRTGRVAGVLARAESFHDLRVKQHYVGLLAQQDVAVVRDLDTLLQSIAAERLELEARIAELAARRDELATTVTQLEGTQVQLATLIAELQSTQAGRAAQQRSLLQEQEALAAELQRLDQALAREVARLEAEERRLRQEAQAFVADRARAEALRAEADQARARIDNLTAPSPAPAAGYVSPLDDAVVTSRFGEGNNSFVSLRASSDGAAVRAVRGGVVISVASGGVNVGHMVAVRHDATLTTVYTNLQPPVVAVGDAVSGGQVVGYLGGSSFVPPDVLRFYVRSTNPAGTAVFVDPGPVLGL
jgi:septal ring factor EnvC (AmiA/AmiB activator)